MAQPPDQVDTGNGMTQIRIIIATVLIIVLAWICRQIYSAGYEKVVTEYEEKAKQAMMRKIENTEKLEQVKTKIITQREIRYEKITPTCKDIYSIDLRACRDQLLGQVH
nr:MAG TPA: hypothetical protein [Inoviridae sp.]